MTNPAGFLKEQRDYESASRDIASCVHTGRRLPDQVFLVKSEHFRFFEFDEVFDERLWHLLTEVSAAHGDRQVIMAAVDPEPTYFKRHFGYFGAAIFEPAASLTEYQDLFSYAPEESPADALRHNSNAITFCSPSHQWAVWAQRDLGLGIFALSPRAHVVADQNASGLKWFSVDDALESLVALNFVGAVVPLDISARLRNHYPP